MTDPARILIVGGGMVGVSLALLLAQPQHRYRHRVCLVEAVALPDAGDAPLSPSFDARSTALSKGTLEIYAQLGLLDTLLHQAAPIEEVHVSRKGRLGISRMRAAEEQCDMLGAVVENRWLGQVLLSALRQTDTEIRAPETVTRFVRESTGYRVTFASGACAHFDLVIAADGATSSTRAALGISARSEDTGHVALIANVQPRHAHQGVAFERFLDSGPLALLPLPADRQALVWTGPRDQIDPLLTLPEADFAAQLEQAMGHRLGEFTRVGERQLYPLVFHQACAQAVPFGLVAGNAAHSLHPVAGQGFNLSLRDMAVLARYLGHAAVPGTLSLLEQYVHDREADQALIRQASRWLPELFRVRFGPVAHTRQLALMALDYLPGLRSRFAQKAMGLANGL